MNEDESRDMPGRAALSTPASLPASEMDAASLLFSFGGFLTSSDRKWVFSTRDDAVPMVEAIRLFAKREGIDLDAPEAQPVASTPTPASLPAMEALRTLADYVNASPSGMLTQKVADAIAFASMQNEPSQPAAARVRVGNYRVPAHLAISQPAAASTASDQVARIVHLRADRSRRVYIAGPMTGLPSYNFPAFNAKAEELRAAGWHVENPAEHGHVEGAIWEDYLRWDISRIATCGAIYLLPGWSRSKGASLEVHIAGALGMEIIRADPDEVSQPAAASTPKIQIMSNVVKGRVLYECAVPEGMPAHLQYMHAFRQAVHEGIDFNGADLSMVNGLRWSDVREAGIRNFAGHVLFPQEQAQYDKEMENRCITPKETK